MQVLAIDGVAIDSLAMNAQGQDAMAKLLGGKVRPVRCPDLPMDRQASAQPSYG